MLIMGFCNCYLRLGVDFCVDFLNEQLIVINLQLIEYYDIILVI